MDARTKDRLFIFDSVEPGRKNQCNVVHPKHIQEEAEQFLDSVFNHFLQGYGAEKCKYMLGGEGHIRRESQVWPSPKITAYLQNLNLTSVTDMVQKREAGLLLPPNKKNKCRR